MTPAPVCWYSERVQEAQKPGQRGPALTRTHASALFSCPALEGVSVALIPPHDGAVHGPETRTKRSVFEPVSRPEATSARGRTPRSTGRGPRARVRGGGAATHPPPQKSFGGPPPRPLAHSCVRKIPLSEFWQRGPKERPQKKPPGEAETQGPTDVDRTAPPQRTKFFRNLSPARARNQSWKYTQSGNRCPAPS